VGNDKSRNITSTMKSLLTYCSEGKPVRDTDAKTEIVSTVDITTLSWKAIIKASLRKLLHG